MSDIDVRQVVRLQADGRCEYCRISELLTLAEHGIDHVIAPIDQFPAAKTFVPDSPPSIGAVKAHFERHGLVG